MKRRYFTRSAAGTANVIGEASTSTKRIRRSASTTGRKSKPKKGPTAVDPDFEHDFEDLSDETSARATISKNRGKSNSKATSAPLATIDSLPDKVLVNIFEMLNLTNRIRIEGVCRRWNSIARLYSWSNTQKIDYLEVADNVFSLEDSSDDDDESETNEDFPSTRRRRRINCRALLSRPRLANNSLCQLLDRAGPYLRSIDLSGYRDTIDYRVLRFIGQQCPKLESINFTGVLVTNTSLRNLAMGCPCLKSISFQRCFHDSVVDRGLASLLSSCPQLTALNLSENERVSGRSFDDLPPTVLHLDLSACYELKDEAVKALADRCPSLKTLHLDCCDRLSVDTLAYAFKRLSQLQILRLNEYYVFADLPSPTVVAAMQNLNKLSQLKELYLNNNYLIDDTVICAVSRGCANLEVLDISGGSKALSDHALISLGRFAFRTMKRLNCNYLSRITDVGVKALARCSRLQSLLLHRCERVGDNGLLELAKHCHELRQLDLSYCQNVTDAVVLAFGRERRRHLRKMETEKKKKEKERNETAETEPVRAGGVAKSKQGKRKSPPGGIVIFAGATKIHSGPVSKNSLVKLNFRDGFNYGIWGGLA